MSAVEVSSSEVIKLCAVNSELFARQFFPKTVRQESPPFHREMDDALQSFDRFVSIMVFRGGAKTSKVRLYLAKQISYGISHTILLVSNAQDHAVKSVEWIKRNIEFNKRWTETFGLRPGAKWTGADIEIMHGIDEYPIRIMAAGITGQVRGINIDDHRPDLIIVDDADNEETTGTEEQLKKTSDLFFGALAKSLAPATEAPWAKMVQLQTPLNNSDLAMQCAKDPQWRSLRYGCFDERGESRWPQRFPTKTLLEDKAAHIKRGQLALWMREMECEIIPEGGASFRMENLKYYNLLPENPVYIIAIDPASSDSKKADDQVVMVLCGFGSRIFVVEYTAEKGEMPEAAGNTVLEYCRRYPILGIYVESISYQRVLAHYLETLMRHHRIFVPVHRVQDSRKKSDRILQAIGRTSGYGNLYVRETHMRWIYQYNNYSPLSKEHDDIMDVTAIGIDALTSMNLPEWDGHSYEYLENAKPKQVNFRQCP